MTDPVRPPDLDRAARLARVRRADELAALVFGEARSARELDNGYELGYHRSPSRERVLREFVESARTQLPALRTEIVAENGALWLRVDGPDGTVDFVRAQLRAPFTRRPSRVMGALLRRWRRVTSAARMTPSFLITGAARAGTTSLYDALARHPDIEAASTKEISFFDRRYHRGLGWYRSHFPLRGRGRGITGEASPTYLFFPEAPPRVFDALPDVRLIASLRSPVERAFSHYNLAVRFGHEAGSFEAALDQEEAGDRIWDFTRYLAWGAYAEQLERWLAVFPRQQLHVLTLEQLKENPATSFTRLFAFLGVAPAELRLAKLHSLPTPPMRAATRQRLVEYYRPLNQRLYDLLGRDFGW